MTAFAESMLAYGTCTPFGGDLLRDEARDRLLEIAPRVDILVNNAGGFVDAFTAADCPPDEWQAQLDANLTLPFRLIQAVLPSMMERRWGRIVNVGSVVATAPQVGNSIAYVAAKAGLLGLTRQVALEVAHLGITVNIVNPGAILTEHLQDYFDSSPVTEQDLASRVPVGRLGKPNEIAAIIPFLTSEAGAYTTGSAIDINGGVNHA
jgi:NAD(P)-dependent dehydrogenase (short-subunit alcohol dehydrogenase family)